MLREGIRYDPVELTYDRELVKKALGLTKWSKTATRLQEFAEFVAAHHPGAVVGVKQTADYQWGIRPRRSDEGVFYTQLVRFGKMGFYDSYIWAYAQYPDDDTHVKHSEKEA